MDNNLVKKDKIITSEIQSISDQNRVIRFVTSTEVQDRDGDVIETSGWQVDNYMKNPVVLFGHDYSALPVGKTIHIELDTMNKRMLQDIQFAKKEEYEFADTVYRMAKAGYLNTTSVGFMGIEHEPMFDDSKNYVGRRYKKQELLETSIVPVPSNPEALIEARSKGILNEKDLKFFTINKSVIPFHDYGIAPESESWDGPSQIKEADTSTLKQICAWYDAQNPDIKSSYKLPHHDATSKKVVWAGVSAAMGALMGARGGVNIPDADRKGVYNHLIKHYKQFNKTPPEFKEYAEKEEEAVVIEKSGATISASNKEKLQAIHDEMHNAVSAVKGCRDKLKEFMYPIGEKPEPECEPKDDIETDGCGKPKPKQVEPKVIKDVALETLPIAVKPEPIVEPIAKHIPDPIADPDDIDIEGMEDPDEIDVTDEQLDKALSAILDKKINQLQGGK